MLFKEIENQWSDYWFEKILILINNSNSLYIWRDLSLNENLKFSTVLKNLDKPWDKSNLSKNMEFDDIIKNLNFDWDNIGNYYDELIKLDIDFNEINWYYLSNNYYLSEEFIRNNLDNLDLSIVSFINKNISLDFALEFKDILFIEHFMNNTFEKDRYDFMIKKYRKFFMTPGNICEEIMQKFWHPDNFHKFKFYDIDLDFYILENLK